MRDAPRHPDVQILTAEQHGVGVIEQIKSENPCQPQAQRLDRPARMRRGAAQETLDQNQPDDGQPDAHTRRRSMPASDAKQAAQRLPVRKRDAGDEADTHGDDEPPGRTRTALALALDSALAGAC